MTISTALVVTLLVLKVAVTVVSAFTVTVHVAALPQPPPLHPENVDARARHRLFPNGMAALVHGAEREQSGEE